MRFNDLQKYNENNKKNTYLDANQNFMLILNVEGGDKVVGNGVVVLKGEHLIRIPKLRRLR